MFLINPYILQASGNPLWDGLQAYYTADNTPNDALGTYNGTLVNGATYGTGIINQGFSFDGLNDYVQLPDNCFKPLNDFSINTWINITGTNIGTVFCAQYSNRGFRVDVLNSNKIFFRFFDSSGTSYDLTSTGTITRGVNQMITITKDSVNGLKVYINGVFDSGNAVLTDVGYDAVNPTLTSIGTARYQIPNFIQWYNGVIDEVATFTDVLTSSEVTELYNSGAGLQY
jgi:hypothetical protein